MLKIENKLTTITIGFIALLITMAIIYQNSSHYILGINNLDVFYYLIESLRMSGMHITGYEHVNYLSPLIPFLTSVLFRLGFVSLTSIFIVTGVFFFIGIMGIFCLLRLKFDNFYSFFGAFLYATLFINIRWVANGTLDIGFIALLIWTLYFFIMGMERNQKYFYIAFPLGVLSFFCKYTGGLIFPLMLLYFMSKTSTFDNIRKYYKNIFGGIIAGALCAIPFFSYFILNNIPLAFFNQASEVASESSVSHSSMASPAANDLFFYIKGLIYDISSTDYIIGIIILLLSVIGALFIIYILFNTCKESYLKNNESTLSVYKWTVSSRLIYIVLVVSIVLVLASFFTSGLVPFYIGEMILFIGLYLFAYSLRKIMESYGNMDSYPHLALNITMLGLFLGYLVFFSAHLIKADRYFTSMAPGFIYLVVLSIEILLNRIRPINLKRIIPIVIMIMMMFVCISYIGSIDNDSLALDEMNAGHWIDGKEGIIYSNRGATYTWILKEEVKNPVNFGDDSKLNEELIEGNASYLISTEDVDLSDYGLVKEYDNVRIYERTI